MKSRKANIVKLISSIWMGVVLIVLLLIGWSDVWADPRDCTVVSSPPTPLPVVRTVKFAQSCHE